MGRQNVRGYAWAAGYSVFVEIRPPTRVKRAPSSQLDIVVKAMTDAASVAAHAQFPLRVRYWDAPKLLFTVKSMDEQAWDD